MGYSPWNHKELDAIAQLSMHKPFPFMYSAPLGCQLDVTAKLYAMAGLIV